jgi:ribonuclease-3
MDRQPHELIGGWRSLSSKEVILDSRLSDRGQVESPSETVRRLSLPFTNLQLLSRALTHRSYINEHPEALEDNERLEFLGDAILDFIVGAWLYNRFPEMSEGDLTRLRSALVRTEQLAEFAQNMDLGHAIRLGRGERNSGGQERPAILCGTFEALVGALYLQGGIPAVEAFIFPLLEEARERVMQRLEMYDSKSHFQEWAQSEGLGTPYYVTVSESGPDHAKEFLVEVRVNRKMYGSGRGTSKQVAEMNAALDALKQLGFANS